MEKENDYYNRPRPVAEFGAQIGIIGIILIGVVLVAMKILNLA